MEMRLAMAAVLMLAPFGAHAQYGPPAPPQRANAPDIPDLSARSPGASTECDLRITQQIIRDGLKKGSFTKPEARRMSREARQIDRLAERFGRDGLSDPERRELETRSQLLRAEAAARRLGTFPTGR